jgi:hypothetical protein
MFHVRSVSYQMISEELSSSPVRLSAASFFRLW